MLWHDRTEQTARCRRAMLMCRLTGVAMLLASFHLGVARVARGAVPPSLAQRTHEPSVESILQALEAKAAAVGGTWRISSGVQDQPGAPYVMGLNGTRWYLKRDEAGAADLVFCDGDEFYEPTARLRYGLDSAEQGRRGDYGLTHYLLSINLRPRQFLGPRRLKNLGETVIDGVTYVRLQANFAEDEALKQDPYAEKTPRQRRAGGINFYYDPTRIAVAQVAVYTPVEKTVCGVTVWDKFGTAGDWPKQMTGKRIDVSVSPNKQVGPLRLTSVSGFTAGEDAQVAAAAESVAAVPFYSGIPDDLRRPAFYASEVASHPSDLTAQVVLAQSHFTSEQPRQGLEQWKALDAKLTQQPARRVLADAMVQPAAESATWRALRDREQAPACAELIGRLLNLELSDAQWKTISRPVCLAWSLFHERGQFAESLAPLDQAMIDRVARHGSHSAVQILMQFANRNKVFAAKIDPVLLSVVSTPLPAEGYVGTQQSILVGITLYYNYWARTAAYTAALQWNASTPAAAKEPVTLIRTILDQRQQTKNAQLGASLVDQYNRTLDPAFPADDFTRRACREATVKVAVEAMRMGGSKKPDTSPPAAFVTASAAKPNAADFWEAVLASLLRVKARTPDGTQAVIAAAGELGVACQTQFNLPDYESRAYLRIHAAKLLDPKVHSPLDNMEFLNKAFAKASLDKTRLDAMKAIVALLGGLGQHDQAQQAVEGLKESLTSADSRASVDALVERIGQDKLRYESEAALRQKQIEADRFKGRLAHLQARLIEAEKFNRPHEEVEILKRAVDQAKQEVDRVEGTAR